MADKKILGRTPAAGHVPHVDALRAAAAGRTRPAAAITSARTVERLIAHADAIGEGRPTVSPAHSLTLPGLKPGKVLIRPN